MQHELSLLRQQTVDTQEHEDKSVRRIEQLEQSLMDLKNDSDDKIARKEREHSQQMNEMHSLQVRKDQQAAAIAQRQESDTTSVLRSHVEKIQDLEAAASERESEFETQTNLYVHKIQELQAESIKQATDHESEVQKHDEEIAQMRTVIEKLQDRVRDIHESKDREVEMQRFQLTQEHDKTMSDLRFKHEEALLKERDTGAKDISELVEKHAQELNDLQAQSGLLVERLKEQLEISRTGRDTSEDAQRKARQDTEHHIQDLEQRIQASNLQAEEAKSALGEAKDLLNSLRDELTETRSQRDRLQEVGASASELLYKSQREIGDLRKSIDTLERNRDDHLATIDKIRGELDATATLLIEKETELTVTRDRHDALVHELKSAHGKKVEESNRVIDDLHFVQNDLIHRANREEEHYGLEIRRLQSQHDQALDASRDELIGLKKKLEEELQDAKATHVLLRDQNATLQEKLQQVEEDAEQRAMRLREAESALKVTKAELVEMQTNRPNSSPYTSSPPPQAGYHRSSLWAASDKSPSQNESENENLGASIIGSVSVDHVSK